MSAAALFGVAAYVVVANVVSYRMFGRDKALARAGQRRIPESTLLWSAVLSGTVGAWLAMRHYRHKTAKTSFQIRMVLATAIDLIVLLAALSLLLG